MADNEAHILPGTRVQTVGSDWTNRNGQPYTGTVLRVEPDERFPYVVRLDGETRELRGTRAWLQVIE